MIGVRLSLGGVGGGIGGEGESEGVPGSTSRFSSSSCEVDSSTSTSTSELPRESLLAESSGELSLEGVLVGVWLG